MEVNMTTASAMETDNSDDMILLVDADSVGDMRSVLRAVRKKCKKMDISIVVETDDNELASAVNPEKFLNSSKNSKKRMKARERIKDNLPESSHSSQSSTQEKRLNGRLKRLLAKKEKMRSASESMEEIKAVEDSETNSTDSGIDMTDLMKNFDDHINKSIEAESCGQCGSASGSKSCKRKRSKDDCESHNTNKKQCVSHSSPQNTSPLGRYYKSRIVGLDCEFVGVGPGKRSALGRCSIVNYDGKVLCDLYCQPDDPITDYRTRWSGIRRKDLINAVPFSQAQNHIRRILQDKIVIGHALHCDFDVLGIHPPEQLVRDTSKYIPLREVLQEKLDGEPRTKYSLKIFSKNLLGRDIQGSEHCSVEDSLAALDLYKLVEDRWEADMGTLPTADCTTSSNFGQNNSHSYFEDSYWPEDLLE